MRVGFSQRRSFALPLQNFSASVSRRSPRRPVPLTPSAEASEIAQLGKISGRALRFSNLGDGKFSAPRLDLEKAYPHEYSEFVRRLVRHDKGHVRRIGALVETAQAEGKQVYLGQVRLGHQKEALRSAREPTFFGIIGDAVSGKRSEFAQGIIDQVGRLTRQIPDAELTWNLDTEIFQELVRELTFDPMAYRFLYDQSAIFDFSMPQAGLRWENVAVQSSGAPFQREFFNPMIRQIRARIYARLTDRLMRAMRIESARLRAMHLWADRSTTLRHLREAKWVQHKTVQAGQKRVDVTLTGYHETEHDRRDADGDLDFFEELQKACTPALERLGNVVIQANFDEKGCGRIWLKASEHLSENDPAVAQIRDFLSGYFEVNTISDTHFGVGGRADKFLSSKGRVDAFCKFLDRVVKNRSTLVLNGDIFDDLRHYDARDIIRNPAYEEIYSRLRQVRRIIFITGNHDRSALGQGNDFELETLHYKMIAWGQRVRQRLPQIWGAPLRFGAWTLCLPALIYQRIYRRRRQRKPGYESRVRTELEKAFPRMHVTPYYWDVQRGLVFEHGDAASRHQYPKIMIKPFIYLTTLIVLLKYGVDRFLLSAPLRRLRMRMRRSKYFPSFARLVSRALNLWLQFDIDEAFEALYHGFRVWVYPGKFFGGRLGYVEERVVNPATRIQVLGEMAHWYTRGKVREWTFTHGHNHQPAGRDEGGINDILKRIFVEGRGASSGPLERIHYLNSGHWSSQTFVSTMFEMAWLEEIGLQTLPTPQDPQSRTLGTAVTYSFGNPHNAKIHRFPH